MMLEAVGEHGSIDFNDIEFHTGKSAAYSMNEYRDTKMVLTLKCSIVLAEKMNPYNKKVASREDDGRHSHESFDMIDQI
jgi:hypothetical protein